jgi:1-hydroxycarotenoid 3,4-desaturase
LFGRYATYVGGTPTRSPAVLGLIWHAEVQGVWRVRGGMHVLAEAVARLAAAKGAEFRHGAQVDRIEVQRGRPVSVLTADRQRLPVDHVVFAGDPRALTEGLLGAAPAGTVPPDAVAPRSLSALVQAFAAEVHGPELAYHNVIFGADPAAEFGPLEQGHLPEDPTVYVCAEDRGGGAAPPEPAPGAPRLERFETIVNAPPLGARPATDEEIARCLTRASETLARSGLTFRPAPGTDSLTTPAGFEALFPASDGSLYGRSPHGRWAAFARPRAATSIPGLVLAGGGAHPGAGVPMATLSGRHAAETIMSARISTSTSRRTAMLGGMSTGSATTAKGPSRSSGSSAPSSRPGTGGPGGKTRRTTAA